MKSRAEINIWLWCSCYIKRKQKKAMQEMWKNNKEAITDMIQKLKAESDHRKTNETDRIRNQVFANYD